MKITFVGTSHGVPGVDRLCSAYMIESGNSFYFVDAGAPLVNAALSHGLDMRDFKGVFTTHAHSDHTNSLPHIIDLVNWYYLESSADFFITDERFSDAIRHFIIAVNDREIDEARIRFHVTHEGIVFEDENIKVEYIPNKHIKYTPSYSILITEGEKRVLFGGDFSNGLRENDIPKLLFDEGVDAFICEMAHFGVEHIKPYLDRARTGKLFFTHVFPLAKYDDIEGIKGKYPYEIFTPEDGFEIEI